MSVNDLYCVLDSTQDTRRSPMWDLTTPTDNADEETKDNFYSSLPQVLDNIPKHDITRLMVDFSARVGQEKSDGPTCSRRFHTQRRHQRLRGKWRHIVIVGTFFAHKNIHKLTWTTPDGNTKSQIDHIMNNSKWKQSLQDCKQCAMPTSVVATTLLLVLQIEEGQDRDQ